MPGSIRKLFHRPEAPNDGLTQPEREPIVDFLNYCNADSLVMLAEDRFITDTAAKLGWDSKTPFDSFDVRSIDNPRNARERRALPWHSKLLLADGAQPDEEDAVPQNLRQLLKRKFRFTSPVYFTVEFALDKNAAR